MRGSVLWCSTVDSWETKNTQEVPVLALSVWGVAFGDWSCPYKCIQPNYLIRSHPLPTSTPFAQMQIIPVLSRVLVLPSIPGRQELRKDIIRWENLVKCVLRVLFCLVFFGLMLVLQSKDSFHIWGLKSAKIQERTLYCNVAALHSAFLFAVRATPMHVAAAPPQTDCFCPLNSKIFSKILRATLERGSDQGVWRNPPCFSA